MDTIAAIATPSGQGGIGIIRVSGPDAIPITEKIIGRHPRTRYAELVDFIDEKNNVIDQGIVLCFRAPHSFTGENVVEFQGHGGPVVLDLLMARILELGARPARAGEFSERAFINDKLDLAQAEAIADLIAADSSDAARAAMRSLQGDFSKAVTSLVEGVIQFRMYVESALDFPEEEIDFLNEKQVSEQLADLISALQQIEKESRRGRLLKEGMTVVLMGRPNAGKSSLLNQLAGQDSAIVTEQPGTTRDLLREHIDIDGMPIHVIDTAGLRESDDVVEREGVKRARAALETADLILHVIDATDTKEDVSELGFAPPRGIHVTHIRNKIDLSNEEPRLIDDDESTQIYLSAKHGHGMDLLRDHLKKTVGYETTGEGQFIARRRHLDAIATAKQHLNNVSEILNSSKQGELVAEELKYVQDSLSSITGQFTSDDLLGRIFSDFCIGK